MTEPIRLHPKPGTEPSELRDFMLVLYRALRMICAYIERRYGA